jgi:hypothetical protein
MGDHKPPAAPDLPEESRYECLGRLLGWSSSLHSEIDVLKRLEKGLSVQMLEGLRSGLGLTDEEISRKRLAITPGCQFATRHPCTQGRTG